MILSFLVGPTLGESSATAIKKLLKAGEEGLDLVQRYAHAEVELSEAAAAKAKADAKKAVLEFRQEKEKMERKSQWFNWFTPPPFK